MRNLICAQLESNTSWFDSIRAEIQCIVPSPHLALRVIFQSFPRALIAQCTRQRKGKSRKQRERKSERERLREGGETGDDAVNQIKWQLKCHSMPKHFKMQAACEKCSCPTTTTTTTTIVRKKERLRLEMAMAVAVAQRRAKQSSKG